MRLLSLEEGEKAVRLARKAIETYLSEKKVVDAKFDGVFAEKRGVFTTLNKHGELRGCIGFPYPVKRLDEAIVDSAISAATQDPRFLPVKLEEMDEIDVEVTVLTPPEKLEAPPEQRAEAVEIGKHGLIVVYRGYSGLLLPQVAVDHGMDEEEFLTHTCLKAGLPPDCWLMESVEVYTFEGQIFRESEPRGRVVEVNIRSCRA